MSDFDFDLAGSELASLFAKADAIGDRYLTPEDVALRDLALEEAVDELFPLLDPELL